MRETSRKTAERLLTEGTNLVVAKDFDMAVASKTGCSSRQMMRTWRTSSKKALLERGDTRLTCARGASYDAPTWACAFAFTAYG